MKERERRNASLPEIRVNDITLRNSEIQYDHTQVDRRDEGRIALSWRTVGTKIFRYRFNAASQLLVTVTVICTVLNSQNCTRLDPEDVNPRTMRFRSPLV